MKKGFLSFVCLCICLSTHAQTNQVRTREFNVKEGKALLGYDPVSYVDGNPGEGSEKLKYEHQGITYFFMNPINLNRFKKDPQQYEPAYGGWCAYAMGKTGEK